MGKKLTDSQKDWFLMFSSFLAFSGMLIGCVYQNWLAALANGASLFFGIALWLGKLAKGKIDDRLMTIAIIFTLYVGFPCNTLSNLDIFAGNHSRIPPITYFMAAGAIFMSFTPFDVITAIKIYFSSLVVNMAAFAYLYDQSDIFIVENIVNILSCTISFLFIFMISITKTRALELELSYSEDEKTVDFLTGLHNRHRAMADFSKLEDGYICISDIDFFKKVNDTFGHDEGDRVLKEFSSLLQNVARHNHWSVYRWGGEEFVIIVKTKKELSYLEGFKSLVPNMIKKPDGTRVTVSIGVSKFGKLSLDLLEEADQCLYKAKENGRNQVIYA